MAKRGPKPKIDDKAITEIYACLTVGSSLQDAADYIGIARSTLTRFKKKDAKFAQGCLQAIKRGKIHHLNKIGKAPQWQASAFMLERKWPDEFGRKEKRNIDVTSGGKPIKGYVGISPDDWDKHAADSTEG